jgi:hypothetical protein
MQAGSAPQTANAGAPADPGRWKMLLDQTRTARDAGVRVALGSGGGAQGLPYGWSSLLGARLLVEAGLTPLQAVTAATSGGAWALGVQSDRGFLAVGQRADLIVVSGDPSSSINDLEKISHVIFGGDVVDRAALRALIANPSGTPAVTESTTNAAANATAGAAGVVDPKARGAKPTARERAAARGKRGAAGTPSPASPESTTSTEAAAAAGVGIAPGTPSSATPGSASSAAASPSAGSAAAGSPSTATPGTASPSAAFPSSASPATSVATAGSSSAAPSGATASSPSSSSSAGGLNRASLAGGADAGASSAGASPGSVATMAAAIVATNPVIDDFERERDASTVGNAWTSSGESTTSSTTVVMGRVVRGARDHALNVTARMGDARDAHARVTVRLAQDGRPLDVSRFHGVRFDARGQGRYRIIFVSRGITDGRFHESNFSGSPLWTPVSIPFASVGQTGKGPRTPWTGRDLVEIVFLLARDPGDFGYLELDNIRFY